MHEAFLSFKQLKNAHIDANLAIEIFNILDEYNIAEKLLCITIDNASNNYKCMKKLSKLLKNRKGIEWNYKEHHINCLNHVINIDMQAFLRTCKVLDIENIEQEEEETENDDNDSDDERDEGLNDDEEKEEKEEEEEDEEKEEKETLTENEEIREVVKSFQ